MVSRFRLRFILCLSLQAQSLLISLISCSSDSEGATQNTESCINGDFIIISTVDGKITALDMDTGKKCWSVLLDSEEFFSSSLSQLEIYENDRRVFLVPSLDGGLYKYYNMKRVIQPLPVDVDSLISHSTFLDFSTSVIGGKMKIIFGIHRLTGEIIYICKTSGCQSFKIPFPDNLLLIEEIIQSVNAIDSTKAEKKWHFRVVELNLKLVSHVFTDNTFFHNNENALVPRKYEEFTSLFSFKISLQNGFAGMVNKSSQDFSWLFKTSCPITDAWYLKNDVLKILDLFDMESGFFNINMDDGKHSSLLFLGTYQKQMFIKKSKKFKWRNMNLSSLSANVLYNNYFFSVCPKAQNVLALESTPDEKDLAVATLDFNVSDHGLYFYINFSIAENATHCIINTSYLVQDESREHLRYWLGAYAVICLSTCFFLFFTIHCVKMADKKELVTTGTSSTELALPGNKGSGENVIEFRSRFHQDFELISVLGKGGFGVVMDVKNKIDDCRYAVKRICLHEKLNNAQYEKVLREVKALAKLDHHGIVRYFNAWIEYPPIGWQEMKDMESNITDITKESCSSESFDGKNLKYETYVITKSNCTKSAFFKKLNQNPFKPFDDDIFSENTLHDDCHFSDISATSKTQQSASYDCSEKSSQVSSSKSVDDHSDSIAFINGHSNSRDELSAESQESCGGKSNIGSMSKEKSSKEISRGYLYIQMQLCQKESLRDWLNLHSNHREYNKVMEIFCEIVEAVHYVHNCGLMHRDLKPSNIYFSLEGAIKIGDFGLATSSEIQEENVVNNQELSYIHTSDVGTEFYMSPEQKLNEDYDCKTDIYSLGIILFELLVPFKTQSERCQVLCKVRQFQFPEKFKRDFQNESELVQLLLDDDPNGRPTTEEIKQHPLLLKYTSSPK